MKFTKPSIVLFVVLISSLTISVVNSQESATVASESLTHGDAVETDESPPPAADLVHAEDQVHQEKETWTDDKSTSLDGEEEPVQVGPFIDLLGTKLHSLQMIDEQSAQIKELYTNDALRGKTVVGLYFSADWCGPCRQFTPELVSFYERMNKRRGSKDKFQIVWVSRCRDLNSHYQYFAHMPWLALPLEEAQGAWGQQLSEKYKVKSIPALVLLDDLGQTITTDARNRVPQDKAGVGFPWRNPLAQIYSVLVPRSLRMMLKLQVDSVRSKIINKLKNLVGLGKKTSTR